MAHAALRRTSSAALLAGLVVAGTIVGAGPAIAIGLVPEAGGQANSEISGQQRQVAAAAAPDGRFVVVWSSATSTGGDTSLDSIQAQRYDAHGVAAGSQFQVNTFTTGSQIHPAVAMDDTGAFYIAWETDTAPVGQDASLSSIRMRGFNSDGTERFAEGQANDFTTGAQILPAMAFTDATLVVTWQSGFSPGDDNSQDSIQARRFASSGAALAAQFQVDTSTAGLQSAPSIGGYPGHGFVLAWGSDDDPSGSTLFRVRARRLVASGTMGSELTVDSAPATYPDPAVAMSATGSFTVAWIYSTDGNGLGIRGRTFDASDVALGAAFPVNDYGDNDQIAPAITYVYGSQLVVAWQSDGSPGNDVSSRSIQLRVLEEPGAPSGLQEQVNVYTAAAQDAPAIAFARTYGRVVVGWESNGSAGNDNQLLSAQWRSYIAPPRDLFADGFQTGDTCRWSGWSTPCI